MTLSKMAHVVNDKNFEGEKFHNLLDVCDTAHFEYHAVKLFDTILLIVIREMICHHLYLKSFKNQGYK